MILRKFTSNLTWKNYYDMYHDDEEHHARCLECGDEIGYGRTDRKFCSLVCKNAYNNRRISIIRKYKSDIMSRLSRNYEILESLLNDKVKNASLEELKALGFDDSCMTGHSPGRRKHEECCCFDIVYYRSENKIFGLRRLTIEK